MINTTQANLSKKLKNNSLYFRDIQNIAEALGYELKIEFVKNKKGEINSPLKFYIIKSVAINYT